jgi:hypothetical protein
MRNPPVDDLFVATLSLILLPVVIVIMAVGLILWFPFLFVMYAFGKIVGRWDNRGTPSFDMIEPIGHLEDVK